MRELLFYNKRFEKAVRNELQIFDRPITEEDALKAEKLSCWLFNHIGVRTNWYQLKTSQKMIM